MTEEMHKYRRKFKQGDELIREGDTGSELYLLERGRLDVLIQGKKIDSIDASGGQEFLGEVAAILGTPRTATVVAATDCVVLCLPNIEIEAVLQSSPSLSTKLIRSLCRKFASNAAVLAEVQAKQERIALTGSTDLSLRNYMRGVLGRLEQVAQEHPGGTAGEALDYFLRTNPWGLQHGDSAVLQEDEPSDQDDAR